MKKIKLGMLVILYLVFLSCSSDNTEANVMDNNGQEEEENTSDGGDGNDNDNAAAQFGLGGIISDCPQGDSNLFDTPVNNNLAPVDRSKFGMKSWSLVEALSDEFNYDTGVPSQAFKDKWKLGFVNDFTGPIPTVWTGEQVSIEDNGVLVLEARETGVNADRRLLCGMISTWAKSSYPLFQEAKVKISNSQLANAVWMLSSDPGTTEEIDNVEAYGPTIRADGQRAEQDYFTDRIHLSHHTFDNQNGVRLDYQPKRQTWMSRKKSEGNCSRDNDVVWSEDFHYFGVKWVSPNRLEYFIDGELVRVVEGLAVDDGIDPQRYTKCGEGLTREMHMLISHAAQDWRYGSVDNFWNSSDIKTGENTKMRIDWLRVYTPTGELNQKSCN
ncbi:family 16 glycosylhydrolase [Aquimarina sp. RZ0]|uniref:family 16 glycosylhydrolase n=1 Tax=Aquimarina sp. RZ0 TaxID=2607730 RepID=UPI0011F2EDC9|nr:family 16 glycosylhydrolase [Aquimarina sp. RZ0]KAA1245070.1 family 16 glycosylhydrolase [Aquimarina sp. RZ0]